MKTKARARDNIEMNIKEIINWPTIMSKAGAHIGHVLKLKLAGVIHIIYNTQSC
jgi:hypothetical protein